jgi:hypothetical protein
MISTQLIPVDHEAVVVPMSGTVKPSKGNALQYCAGIYCGVAGNLVVTFIGSDSAASNNQTTATYAVLAGQMVLGKIASVDHSTTASGLIFQYLSL